MPTGLTLYWSKDSHFSHWGQLTINVVSLFNLVFFIGGVENNGTSYIVGILESVKCNLIGKLFSTEVRKKE